MILKILSTQVSTYWELIKFAVTTVDEVDKEDLQPYLIELLHALLSDKAQCWIRLDEKRTIIALLITRIRVNKITAKKSLYLQSIFSYRQVPLDIWQKDFNMLVQFAKQEGCKKITFDSRNPRIWEITTSFGCLERYRSFEFRLKDERRSVK